MIKTIKKLYSQRKKRYLKKIQGNSEKLRLSIFCSRKHIYAQLIDDNKAITLASSSSLEKEVKEKSIKSRQKIAHIVGENIGKRAFDTKMSLVVFDKGKRAYQGRIKCLAEGARKIGLKF